MSFSAAPAESFDVIVVGSGPSKSQLVHEMDALFDVIRRLASTTAFHRNGSTNKTSAAWSKSSRILTGAGFFHSDSK